MQPVVASEQACGEFEGLRAALLNAGMAVRVGEAGIGAAVARADGRTVYLRRAARSTLRMVGDDCEIAVGTGDDPLATVLTAELVRTEVSVAADTAARTLFALAKRVAPHDVSVLIGGPSGSGKEVLARIVHACSGRTGAFVAVNCAALPEAMLEALLFGHERGAFTGAGERAKGLFRAAEGGTLLLDEIGELPLGLQAKLLRVLQEREVLPLGATVPVKVDVRIIAATNRDLASEVAAGRFREDLLYRINVFPLAALPLSARPGDLLPLVASLLLRHGRDRFAWPSPEALAKLAAHPWPGNVRELENILQRALILADNGRIEAADIRFDAPPARAVLPPDPETLGDIRREREFEAIEAALAACGGRRVATANKLGISERTLRYKLAEMASFRQSHRIDATLQ